jgi:hypothetical protein
MDADDMYERRGFRPMHALRNMNVTILGVGRSREREMKMLLPELLRLHGPAGGLQRRDSSKRMLLLQFLFLEEPQRLFFGLLADKLPVDFRSTGSHD